MISHRIRHPARARLYVHTAAAPYRHTTISVPGRNAEFRTGPRAVLRRPLATVGSGPIADSAASTAENGLVGGPLVDPRLSSAWAVRWFNESHRPDHDGDPGGGTARRGSVLPPNCCQHSVGQAQSVCDRHLRRDIRTCHADAEPREHRQGAEFVPGVAITSASF